MFPVKSHLPLITTHVEFDFNTIPPPPQITPRKELAANIQQLAHRTTFSPYFRTQRIHKEAAFPNQPNRVCEETPFPAWDDKSDSSLSDLSDDEASDQVDNAGKIPKPAGEAGRAKSGGYNLERAMNWEASQFAQFTKLINDEVAGKLDIKKCFSKQKPVNVVDEIIQRVAEKFNIKNVYVNDWPIRNALKMRLKYTSDLEKKKVQRKALEPENQDA